MNMMQVPQMVPQLDTFSQGQQVQIPTLEQIKSMNEQNRQQTLHTILTMKISGIVPADRQSYTQKIAGLVGDLSTFSVEDVYKLIENPQDLATSVKQAIEVIDESQ